MDALWPYQDIEAGEDNLEKHVHRKFSIEYEGLCLFVKKNFACIHTHTNAYTHIHTYIHTHMHAYTHTYTYPYT